MCSHFQFVRRAMKNMFRPLSVFSLKCQNKLINYYLLFCVFGSAVSQSMGKKYSAPKLYTHIRNRNRISKLWSCVCVEHTCFSNETQVLLNEMKRNENSIQKKKKKQKTHFIFIINFPATRNSVSDDYTASIEAVAWLGLLNYILNNYNNNDHHLIKWNEINSVFFSIL